MGSAETGFGPDDSSMCTESRKGAAGTGIVPNVLADHIPVSALQSPCANHAGSAELGAAPNVLADHLPVSSQ